VPVVAVAELSPVEGEDGTFADEKPGTVGILAAELLVVDRILAVREGDDLVPAADEPLSPGH